MSNSNRYRTDTDPDPTNTRLTSLHQARDCSTTHGDNISSKGNKISSNANGSNTSNNNNTNPTDDNANNNNSKGKKSKASKVDDSKTKRSTSKYREDKSNKSSNPEATHSMYDTREAITPSQSETANIAPRTSTGQESGMEKSPSFPKVTKIASKFPPILNVNANKTATPTAPPSSISVKDKHTRTGSLASLKSMGTLSEPGASRKVSLSVTNRTNASNLTGGKSSAMKQNINHINSSSNLDTSVTLSNVSASLSELDVKRPSFASSGKSDVSTPSVDSGRKRSIQSYSGSLKAKTNSSISRGSKWGMIKEDISLSGGSTSHTKRSNMLTVVKKLASAQQSPKDSRKTSATAASGLKGSPGRTKSTSLGVSPRRNLLMSRKSLLAVEIKEKLNKSRIVSKLNTLGEGSFCSLDSIANYEQPVATFCIILYGDRQTKFINACCRIGVVMRHVARIIGINPDCFGDLDLVTLEGEMMGVNSLNPDLDMLQFVTARESYVPCLVKFQNGFLVSATPVLGDSYTTETWYQHFKEKLDKKVSEEKRDYEEQEKKDRLSALLRRKGALTPRWANDLRATVGVVMTLAKAGDTEFIVNRKKSYFPNKSLADEEIGPPNPNPASISSRRSLALMKQISPNAPQNEPKRVKDSPSRLPVPVSATKKALPTTAAPKS